MVLQSSTQATPAEFASEAYGLVEAGSAMFHPAARSFTTATICSLAKCPMRFCLRIPAGACDCTLTLYIFRSMSLFGLRYHLPRSTPSTDPSPPVTLCMGSTLGRGSEGQAQGSQWQLRTSQPRRHRKGIVKLSVQQVMGPQGQARRRHQS
ncbi:hypothetical protein BDR05DRAFT_548775 [Suillus weaverae]|nr:hypothetical protein BDR05DRAFT_548775 [Suillus weaverae]